MRAIRPSIVLVTMPTRLKMLRRRYGTVAQAAFVLRQAHAHQGVSGDEAVGEAGFAEYQREDAAFQSVIEHAHKKITETFDLPLTAIERDFLPTFNFAGCAVVIVIGQDGLVANVAKYVRDTPIIGVNPDPSRIDGVLLPFSPSEVLAAVRAVISRRFRHRPVTLAEATLNDGERLLAFNDLFIGCSSHASARYVLGALGGSEPQSSSGILVSTGAGSTGWLSSVFNMNQALTKLLGGNVPAPPRAQWEDRKLFWAVREPFISRHSQASLVAGIVEEGHELIVESLMPSAGVIFSDGIENDFLAFNSGTIARIGVSRQIARLVVPG
jgi:hypothetical protein